MDIAAAAAAAAADNESKEPIHHVPTVARKKLTRQN
jgi:hypothetical protein